MGLDLGAAGGDDTDSGNISSSYRLVCTAQFLKSYESQEVDTCSKQFISQIGSDWAPHIRQMRLASGMRDKEINWADFRYNCLVMPAPLKHA